VRCCLLACLLAVPLEIFEISKESKPHCPLLFSIMLNHETIKTPRTHLKKGMESRVNDLGLFGSAEIECARSSRNSCIINAH